ncbi:MAG: dCTP deaminase [Patescibacteria group bacterium]
MFLSDVDIKKAVKKGDIVIRDFCEENLQPASYDISLGNKFIFNVDYMSEIIDPVKKIFPETREITIEKNGTIVLYPGVSVLATSVEYFGSEHFLIHLSGKSSLARVGLVVHNTAGIINPGHFLHVTFELSNSNNIPIVLRPNMAIAQILFSTLSSPPRTDYKKVGRYHDNDWNSYVPPKERGIKKKK